MRKTYTGSCHCGTVRFEADLDVAVGTTKCNCSICSKMRLWAVQATQDTFRLLTGADDLTDFRGHNAVAHHLFCRHCGVHAFEWIDVPNTSGAPYYNINVACLDGLDINELMASPVTYRDGRNNDWGAVPTEVRHL